MTEIIIKEADIEIVKQALEESMVTHNLLRELVIEAVDCGVAREIDSGCNGDGVVARVIQHMSGCSFDEANKLVWGEEWETNDE